MKLTINGTEREVPDGLRLQDAAAQFCVPGCVTILNGFQTNENIVLCNSDSVTLIQKGVLPPADVLEHMMASRHSPKVHQAVKRASVGIAGLGGLGSNIAVMLARTGIGRLVLADFDVVEPSNLNRQNYCIRHLGMAKTDALAEQILDINPYITVETHCVRITENNAAELFRDCEIVCEAFDNPDCKSMLVSTLLDETDVRIVSGSGMAGYGSANEIVTRRRFSRLYVCGDGVTAAQNGVGLMAPRATLCAAHQANAVLRLILGEQP